MMEKRAEIFCCYAREDQLLLLKLRKHLASLERGGLISVWHDTDISPGAEWEEEINKHLDTADIILLLVSPSFMASDYCYSREMKRAMERHEQGEVRVIPVILRPVLWQSAPFSKLQVLPTGAKPVTGTGWHNSDEAFFDIAEGIRKAVDEFLGLRHQSPKDNPLPAISSPGKNTLLAYEGHSVQDDVVTFLRYVAERLREEKLPKELVVELDQLAVEVKYPCVVAMVGPVRAGKSTLINALLGEDLVKVGSIEATATINYFRHGTPNPDRPVCCYWRRGHVTDETRQFLDDLQGNDIETQRRADGIDYLEYRVPHPYLEQVVLVDTPGTGAGAVVDAHRDRTAEFINLERHLRIRHHSETQQIASKADAVIYVINLAAHESDKAFLEEFRYASQGQSRAFNAIAVMTKIDLYPDVMKHRTELAAKIADQLRDQLSTVVPISAALHQAMDRLLENNEAGLRQLIEAMRRIPSARLEKFLDNAEFYLESDPPDCPVTPDQRRELLGEMDWNAFTTIARAAADPTSDVEGVTQRVNELAGFDQLREVLERYFFKRSYVLRCHRILRDAYGILSMIKYAHLSAGSMERRKALIEELKRDFGTIISRIDQ